MKISKISVFQKDLPYCGGGLAVGDLSKERARKFDTFNSTVVVVETDARTSQAERASKPSWLKGLDLPPETSLSLM